MSATSLATFVGRCIKVGALAMGLVCGLASIVPAGAQVGLCRSDPVFTLSNGVVVTLYETIGDTASDVTGIHYDLHVSAGLTVTSVSYIGDIASGLQSWTLYTDEKSNDYDTYTTVSTGSSNIQVQAYLQAGSAQSIQQNGPSNQSQHMQLHMHANGGGVVTVTANNETTTYGNNLQQPTFSLTGFTNGDTANVLAGQPSCSYSVPSSSPVATYHDAIVCTQGNLSSPAYTFKFVPGDLTVIPAPLTITAHNAQTNYGTPVTIEPDYHGFVNGDSASSLTTPPTCGADATAVGTWPVNCHGAADPNYTITYVEGTLQITPENAAISLTSQDSATVDVTSPGGVSPKLPVSATISAPAGSIATALPVTYTLSGNGTTRTCTDTKGAGVSGNTLLSTCSFSSSAPGNYNLTVSTNGNYNGNSQSNLTVSTASTTMGTITVAAKSASTTYGSVPNVTWTYYGFQGTDSAKVLSGNPSCGSVLGAATVPGNYTGAVVCTQGNLSAQNYNFKFVPGTLSVYRAPLTIKAADGSMTYGSKPSVTPQYQGLVNHDTAAALTTQPTCNANATSTSPVGQYADYCWGAASSKYRITYANGHFNVQPASATMSIPAADTGPWPVGAPGGTATVPVTANVTSTEGSIGTALPIQYQLNPAWGGPPAGSCTDTSGKSTSGETLRSGCTIGDVPPGVYTLKVHDQSTNYNAPDTSGGAVVVVDPSITTQVSDNGQVNHNGTTGQMNFNAHYKAGALYGSMSYTEQGAAGTTSIVATKLTGLIVQPNPNNGQTTVSLTGKGTYDGTTGYSFVATAISNASSGAQQTGLLVMNPAGASVTYISFNPQGNTSGQLTLS